MFVAVPGAAGGAGSDVGISMPVVLTPTSGVGDKGMGPREDSTLRFALYLETEL